MIEELSAWNVKGVVNSLQFPHLAKYALVATSKALSQLTGRNVQHALPVDSLLIIIMMLQTMIQSKNASSVPLEHTVMPVKCPVTDALLEKEHFENTTSNKTTCVPCDSGRYQPAAGENDCIDCIVGKYQSENGTAYCLPCNAINAIIFSSGWLVTTAGTRNTCCFV